MRLSDKWALVTGAGQGIGKGCALELARAGADLILNDRPASAEVHETASEIQALGCQCHVITADVFTRAGCEALVKEALAAVPGPDILVSNPAYSVRGGFLEFDPGVFEKVVQGALASGFHLSQLVARQMVSRGRGGKIVFISSVQGAMPYARSVAYNAAKAGLNHLARTAAVELSQYRINVNAIEPGWIDTPGERRTFDEQTIEREGQKLPWGRLGTPADIGRAATFLCSPDADYITGEILRVDGGFWFKDCRAQDVIPERPLPPNS